MRDPFPTVPAWSSWDAVVAFYKNLAKTQPVILPMVEFTRQIAASPSASGLFPGLSHNTRVSNHGCWLA